MLDFPALETAFDNKHLTWNFVLQPYCLMMVAERDLEAAKARSIEDPPSKISIIQHSEMKKNIESIIQLFDVIPVPVEIKNKSVLRAD